MDVFPPSDRKDRSPRRPNESSFEFLHRSGSEFSVPVRELLQRWVNALPIDDRPGVVGNLSSADDDAFDSAFWELYLHQMLTGSGFDVEVHPDVPGTSRHPDFLVHAPQPFYLEAVSVGIAPLKANLRAAAWRRRGNPRQHSSRRLDPELQLAPDRTATAESHPAPEPAGCMALWA